MSVNTRDFLKRRRDRALGSIMGGLERNPLWPQLNDSQRAELRGVVIEALNSYHDTTLDLLKAEDDVARNDEVLAVLTRLERQIQRPSKVLDGQLSAEVAR